MPEHDLPDGASPVSWKTGRSFAILVVALVSCVISLACSRSAAPPSADAKGSGEARAEGASPRRAGASKAARSHEGGRSLKRDGRAADRDDDADDDDDDDEADSADEPEADEVAAERGGLEDREGENMDSVQVNGVALSHEVLDGFARRYGMRIPAGRYWYDGFSGAWGVQGGPTLGFTAAGLDLGGRLRPDASGGGSGMLTGVFINGREIHPRDVWALAQIVTVVPGRYWVDRAGNFGYEGYQQTLGNLVQIAQARSVQQGNSYLRRTAGGYIGGDGETSYFFDPSSGASVIPGEGVSY